MNRRWTKELFVAKSNAIHANKYDYSLLEWDHYNAKVSIICPIHGVFQQSASKHLAGQGCGKCRGSRIAASKRKQLDKFIEEANNVHNNIYSYTNVEYKNNSTKVAITCKSHGDFMQAPSSHLSGQGCPKCGFELTSQRYSKIFTTDLFLSRVKAIHGDLYDYSLVKYTKSANKVKIICKEHGVFSQAASAHLAGNGCPDCSNTGFSYNSSGNFYIFTDGYRTKVGITNNHPSERLYYVNYHGKLSMELVEYFNFESGKVAHSLEQYVLSQLREVYEQCPTDFDGSKECFLEVPYDFIKKHISTFLIKHRQT